jgi:hypothetical protein
MPLCMTVREVYEYYTAIIKKIITLFYRREIWGMRQGQRERVQTVKVNVNKQKL